jgi:hypothetical protein
MEWSWGVAWLVAHFLVSMLWLLGASIAQTSAIWFMSGTLVFSHGCFFLLLMAMARNKGAKLERHEMIMVLVCAIFALAFIGCYMTNLFYAKYQPELRADNVTRQLAVAIWNDTPAAPILVLVLLSATAFLHLIDIGVCAWLVHKDNETREMALARLIGSRHV